MIDIAKAEQYLLSILPKRTTVLSGEINTLGTYLLFNHISINNGFIDDVTYHFNCYIALNTPTARKAILYDDLSDVLNRLTTAQQDEQCIEVKSAKPFSNNKLIIYQLEIAVTPPLQEEDLWNQGDTA